MKVGHWLITVLITIALVAVMALTLPFSSDPAKSNAARKASFDAISSIKDLKSALEIAENGDVIKVLPGTYPVTELKTQVEGGQVIIQSANPEDPAQFDGLVLSNAKGLTLRGIAFAGPAAEKMRYKLLVINSANIKLNNLSFTGSVAAYQRRTISAVMLRDSSNVEFSDSVFSLYRHGIAMLNLINAQITGNEFTEMQTDGVRGGGVSQAVIANNIFAHFRPAPGDHPDGIQLWSTHQKTAARDIIIRDNLVVRGKGAPTQGVFVRDTHEKLPFENLEIRGNLVIGSLYNGIAVNGLHGGVIADNEVLAFPGRKSWIRLDNGKDVRLSNNKAMAYVSRNNERITETGNIVTEPNDKDVARHIRTWLLSKGLKPEEQSALLTSLSAE